MGPAAHPGVPDRRADRADVPDLQRPGAHRLLLGADPRQLHHRGAVQRLAAQGLLRHDPLRNRRGRPGGRAHAVRHLLPADPAAGPPGPGRRRLLQLHHRGRRGCLRDHLHAGRLQVHLLRRPADLRQPARRRVELHGRHRGADRDTRGGVLLPRAEEPGHRSHLRRHQGLTPEHTRLPRVPPRGQAAAVPFRPRRHRGRLVPSPVRRHRRDPTGPPPRAPVAPARP
ncbi:hypothetical protein SGPA1_31068 [Streptomyces misionensis JCM 4497]